MGVLISLSEARAARAANIGAASASESAVEQGKPLVRRPATIWFDLDSPLSYLAAERADRTLPGARWRPAFEEILTGRPAGGGMAGMAHAEQRAAELGVPLSWPARWPASGRAAMRVAALAADRGVARQFALAAGRLQFCGGFDLSQPDILAEAAAAAGLGLQEALDAARDEALDGALEAASKQLLREGATGLPAFRVGRRLFCGESSLPEAGAMAGPAPRPLGFPSWGV